MSRAKEIYEASRLYNENDPVLPVGPAGERNDLERKLHNLLYEIAKFDACDREYVKVRARRDPFITYAKDEYDQLAFLRLRKDDSMLVVRIDRFGNVDSFKAYDKIS